MGINISKNIDKSLNLSFDEYEIKMRDYAIQHSVPIISDEGLRFLEDTIKKYNIKTLLEVGTAIGYSAERISKANNTTVYTIERDINMFEEASKNIKALGLDKVYLIFNDALEAYEDIKEIEFDAIFIDAAKGQYKKFFEIYTKNLKKGGIVICDNMSFHGLLEKDTSTMSRSLRGLVRKLKDFHSFLDENTSYDTTFFEIGDGMTISIKK